MLPHALFSLASYCLVSTVLAGIPVDSNVHERSLNNPPSLSISGQELTSKWVEGSNQVQIIELLVTNNDGSLALTADDTLSITASGSSVVSAQTGTLVRLLPGQAAVVQVGITNAAGVTAGSYCNVTLTATWGQAYGKTQTTTATVSGTCGFGNYAASSDSLATHSTPDWYDNAKFGIFIHWGLYSAPAYGSVSPNEDYAEWYWKRQHDPTYRTQTYQYHLATYGENFNYDDFIANFTASSFNAKTWLDLIAASGAQYFVPVTKHHDGFAIFDVPASTSMRSSVNYGPKRDFLNELFTAAKTHYPKIRRGTYFSMPEWYHPGYAKYAITWGGGFPGGPPTNPYTGAVIPYTGYVPVNDFVQDLQYPQMRTLAYTYDTELMWCDIGGANNSPQMLSDWVNWARGQGRQVVFNSRCGVAGDFDTPEYSTNSQTVVRKWESNRGMDPFSFGYNYQTPDSQYLTGADIVNSLVDIVSKNGNFLLDIGPRNDGIIPQIMQQGLTDAGKWITAHAESIFGTRFWQVTSGINSLRYTTTVNAFYIHVLSTPSTSLHITDKIPYLAGDVITVLGGSMNGAVVPVTLNGDGTVTLAISSAMIAADNYVWTFKLAYKGASSSITSSTTGVPSKTTSTSTTLSTSTTSTSGSGPASCTSALWGQCAGIGWTGCTQCVSGTTCKYINDYYSQCLQG